DESTVYNSILSGYPVMANAYSERDGDWPFYSYSGRHAWVIDGWRKKRYNYTTTYHWIVIGSTNDEANIDWTQGNITQYTYSQGLSLSGGNEYTYSYSQSPEYNYILMNWGWDGSYDNTEYSSSTAINWTAGGHTFEYIVEIMYGFN
ncbi:MAG: C10 family peptidase, partial [Bacteroidales bacterium]|nr:C10 family peptidase [Bacteroidales bacterium]